MKTYTYIVDINRTTSYKIRADTKDNAIDEVLCGGGEEIDQVTLDACIAEESEDSPTTPMN